MTDKTQAERVKDSAEGVTMHDLITHHKAKIIDCRVRTETVLVFQDESKLVFSDDEIVGVLG